MPGGPEQQPGVGSVAPPVKSTAATVGGPGSGAQTGTRPPQSRFQNYLNSGSRKHVLVGLLIVSAVTCAPWFLLTSGSKHGNHADYMDAAEKARRARLSSSSAASSS